MSLLPNYSSSAWKKQGNYILRRGRAGGPQLYGQSRTSGSMHLDKLHLRTARLGSIDFRKLPEPYAQAILPVINAARLLF